MKSRGPSCEHGVKKTPDATKGGAFIEWLSDRQLVKEDTATQSQLFTLIRRRSFSIRKSRSLRTVTQNKPANEKECNSVLRWLSRIIP